MNKRHKDKKDDTISYISISHLTAYLDRVKKGLFLVLLFTTFIEIIMCILVRSKVLNLSQQNIILQMDLISDKKIVYIMLLIQIVLNWIIYLVDLIIYKRSNLQGKKIISIITFFLITTVYSFCHLGYIYLSIIYVIPIIFVCPLGKRIRTNVLLISILLTITYTLFQNSLIHTGAHALIFCISITILVGAHLISGCIYKSIVVAMKDIEQYSKLSSELYEEVSHDYVTGAFSKVTLHKDIASDNNFKSIAFIDIDDFKLINDTYGHSIGDNILQTLVRCFSNKHESVYRYGGDEFVVLSKLSVKDLASKIVQIKNNYTHTCLKNLSCKTTFSAGVRNFDHAENKNEIEELLSKSDEVMYIAKHNGKNQVSVGA